MTESTDSTEQNPLLHPEDRKVAIRLLRDTPISALKGGMVSPSNINRISDVLDQFAHVVNYLKFEMNCHDDVREELNALKRDLRAAGRVLNLITNSEPPVNGFVRGDIVCGSDGSTMMVENVRPIPGSQPVSQQFFAGGTWRHSEDYVRAQDTDS